MFKLADMVKAPILGVPVILFTCLAGCARDDASHAPEGAEFQYESAYISPLPDSAPTLKVATWGYDAPFNFRDEYGNAIGIDIDVIRAIGEEEGFKVEFYFEPFERLFGLVDTGRYDLTISNIAYRPERANLYGLSKPYVYNPLAIAQKKGEPIINNIYALAGKRVAVVSGTSSQDLVTAAVGAKAIYPTSSDYLSMEAVLQGHADVIVTDLANFKAVTKDYPEYQWQITPIQKENEMAAYSVILTAKKNTELLAKINDGIDKLEKSGKLEQIKQKWFEQKSANTETNP